MMKALQSLRVTSSHYYSFSPTTRTTNTYRTFSACPFQILGLRSTKSRPNTNRLESSVSYEEVRVAFRKLALRYHPDMVASQLKPKQEEENIRSKGNGESDYSLPVNIAPHEFSQIREAFEAIIEGPNGIAILRDERRTDYSYGEGRDTDQPGNKDGLNNNCIDDEQYGFLHKSVNPSVLHEVAEVAATMNPGGLDRGGMWQYANMIRKMAESDSRGLPPLQVDGGSVHDKSKRVQRRRKRR